MRLVALFRKDLLLLLRDPWGLVLLFLMPWALVILMASLQDSTFRTLDEQHIPLLLLNEDADSLGNTVSRELANSHLFDITSTAPDGRPLTAEAVETAVARGDYLIGVVIPSGTTDRLRQRVARGVAQAFGGEEDTVAEAEADPLSAQPLEIRLWVDPTAKPSFRATLLSAVREHMLTVQNRLLLGEISRHVNRLIPMPIDLEMETEGWITVHESYARTSSTADLLPNATQHNVPAWSMFAVFFIVISLAGNMIRERETGCFARLLTMPCPYALYLTGKVFVHLLVCLLQLALLLLTGLYLMPHLGLPPLRLGHDHAALGPDVHRRLAVGCGLRLGHRQCGPHGATGERIRRRVRRHLGGHRRRVDPHVRHATPYAHRRPHLTPELGIGRLQHALRTGRRTVGRGPLCRSLTRFLRHHARRGDRQKENEKLTERSCR